MKFEKFAKNSGIYGQIVELEAGDKWLVCNGIGMMVPNGLTNLLGIGTAPEKVQRVVESITEVDTDDKVVLTSAYLKADGKPTEIVRIFGDEFGYGVGIKNKDFGLIERSDVNMCHVEIVLEDGEELRCLVILDRNDEPVGFIAGIDPVVLENN